MYLKLLLGTHTFIIIKCLSLFQVIFLVLKLTLSENIVFLPCIPFPFSYFRSICVFIFTVCYSISELLCHILISVPQVTDALFISAFFSLFIQDSFYHCVSNLLIFSFIVFKLLLVSFIVFFISDIVFLLSRSYMNHFYIFPSSPNHSYVLLHLL